MWRAANYKSKKDGIAGAFRVQLGVILKLGASERLPKPVGGTNGRNMRGVAFQVFQSLYRALASVIHA